MRSVNTTRIQTETNHEEHEDMGIIVKDMNSAERRMERIQTKIDGRKRRMCSMSESKSIYDIHLEFVEQLKARGEQVVQPRGEPMGPIKGYDKTIGLISAGTIAVYKQGAYTNDYLDLEAFDLIQDMCTHVYTGVKGGDLGLCDARCWYEAIEEKRMQDANANKEYAGKQATDLPRVELIPLLKQEHILEILSGLIDEFHYMNRIEDAHTDAKNTWKQDFLKQLKIPIEIKEMLDTRRKDGRF